MLCLGFISDPGKVVLTEDLVGKENYSAVDIACFATIHCQFTDGVKKQDVRKVAHAATRSARLNQKRLQTRQFATLMKVSKAGGACGLAVSHSGVTAAAIFDPKTYKPGMRQELGARLKDLGCNFIHGFNPC
jgi:uncharacterized protein involved in propanediol utilization